jgi:sugar/nucleoside kinase (ribokinase family)
MSLGPKVVVIKKGEHGSLYVSKSRVFIAPAYPVENVYDPTGAGDTFAGGMMGYLSKTNGLRWGDMKKAVIYGSVMASFAVEGPGISRLLSISLKDVNKRYEKIKEMTRF